MSAPQVGCSRSSRHRRRRPPDQHLVRVVRVSVTEATVASLAGAVLPQAPNECRQVCQMARRHLPGGSQMFQAIRLDDPQRVVGEDLSDPSLLGTREHDATMVAERAGVGQRGELTLAGDGLRRDSIRARQPPTIGHR
jgi:hypothetical protein